MDTESLDYRVGCAQKARLKDLEQDHADIIARRGRALAVDEKADVAVFDKRLSELEKERAYILSDSCYLSVALHEAEEALKVAQEKAARLKAESDAASAEVAALQEKVNSLKVV